MKNHLVKLTGALLLSAGCYISSPTTPSINHEIPLNVGEIRARREQIYACVRTEPQHNLASNIHVLTLGSARDNFRCEERSISSRIQMRALPDWSFDFMPDGERILCIGHETFSRFPTNEAFPLTVLNPGHVYNNHICLFAWSKVPDTLFSIDRQTQASGTNPTCQTYESPGHITEIRAHTIEFCTRSGRITLGHAYTLDRNGLPSPELISSCTPDCPALDWNSTILQPDEGVVCNGAMHPYFFVCSNRQNQTFSTVELMNNNSPTVTPTLLQPGDWILCSDQRFACTESLPTVQ